MIPHARFRLAAYLLVVATGAVGFWRVETTVNRLDTLVRERDAEQCVSSWTARAQIREAITIPGEAIIQVSPSADPARVAEFREAVDHLIREAFPDPDCSLEAAMRVLGG